MRVLGYLNKHPKLTVTVFQMNDKYVIKFEAGLMEQVFKLNTTEVTGLEAIDKMIDEEFTKNVIERFNDMFLSLNKIKEVKNQD